MDEPITPLPERVESHYRDRRVWLPVLLLSLMGLQVAMPMGRLLSDPRPVRPLLWVLAILLVPCFFVFVWALIAQRRGYRVVLDRTGISRDGWPAFSLPWSQIGRVDRSSLRDKGLLMIYRAGKRPKVVRIELKDVDAAYAFATAMTGQAAQASTAPAAPWPGPRQPDDLPESLAPLQSQAPSGPLSGLLVMEALTLILVGVPLLVMALMKPGILPFALGLLAVMLVVVALMCGLMWWLGGARTSVVDADATGLCITTLGRDGQQMSRVDVPWDDVSLLRTRTRGRYAQFRVTRRFTGKKALAWGRLDPATLPAFEALARAHGVQVVKDA